MQRTATALIFALVTSMSGIAASAAPPTFKKQQLTDQFWAEGSAVGDLNRDGHPDVVYGPFWLVGPSFTDFQEYRPATASFSANTEPGSTKTIPGFEGGLGTKNAYSDNFFTWTHDFNQDGWTDIFLIDMPNKPAHWFENPKGRSGHWKRHTVFDQVDNESPTFTDLTGDGRPELICNYQGRFGYAEPNWDKPEAAWAFRAVSPDNNYGKYNHGLGVGDVNADGRHDLLEKDGWWEQPESLEGNPIWKHHAFTFSPPTDQGVPVGGAQMFAYDVNADGLNDVITCFASHGYYLVWWEQLRSNGVTTFKCHKLTGKVPSDSPRGTVFSQIHAIELVDMNGDGLQDILTGKRFWAHGPSGDPEPNAPAVVYWFELTRPTPGQAEYLPHLIDDNSGVGTQVTFADLNGDHRPDVISGNKKGAFVFLQE